MWFDSEKMISEQHKGFRLLIPCAAFVIALLTAIPVRAEDGYRLWLRYDPLPAKTIEVYKTLVTVLVVPGSSPTIDALRTELVSGCTGLMGRPVPVVSAVNGDGAVIVGTPQSSPLIASLRWQSQLAQLGPEGFRIRSLKLGTHWMTVIASSGEVGALYGAFHFLRLMQTLQPINKVGRESKAALAIAHA